MTLLNLGDILELKTYSFLNNQLGINVIHYDVTALTGAPSLEATATGIAATLPSLYQALECTAANFQGITLAVLAPSPIAPVIRTDNAGPGTVTGDPLPTQVAGVISFRTAVLTQAGRGRVYVPFPSEEDNFSTGLCDAGYVVRLQNLGDYIANPNFIDQGSGDTVTIQGSVYHRQTTTSTLMAAALARPKWGTQRKRGSYGKENVVPF